MIISFTKYFVGIDDSAKSYIKLIRNTLFKNILQSYSKIDIILGGYDSYIDILNKGDFYENFKPNKKKFSGFNIKLGFDINKSQEGKILADKLYKMAFFNKSKYKGNHQFESYNRLTMQTGKKSKKHLNLRTISKINDEKVFNTVKQIFSNDGDTIYYRVPIFRGKPLVTASDGFQYSTDKNVIFYYDKFSSNVLNFEYKSGAEFSNLNCDFYQLSNTLQTAMTEKDFGKSLIIKNSKSKFFLLYISNLNRYYREWI